MTKSLLLFSGTEALWILFMFTKDALQEGNLFRSVFIYFFHFGLFSQWKAAFCFWLFPEVELSVTGWRSSSPAGPDTGPFF